MIGARPVDAFDRTEEKRDHARNEQDKKVEKERDTALRIGTPLAIAIVRERSDQNS